MIARSTCKRVRRMTKKQKKMLTRIIAAAVLLIPLNFLPVTGIIRFVLFLIPYLIVGYDIFEESMEGNLKPSGI